MFISRRAAAVLLIAATILVVPGSAHGWAIETVDSDYNAGEFTSLVLDAAGHPHISYYDRINGDLKYARWNGNAWEIKTVDSSDDDVGIYTSLALDAAGYPHISYYDVDNQALKYAAWNGNAWANETVDSDSWVGTDNSLALDAAGHPHISYCDRGNYDLKYAAWNGTAWAIQIVDSNVVVVRQTSLALDAAGHPHISYYDISDQALKYAAWNGTAWEIETLDSGGHVGACTSLALDSAGYPHISYYDDSKYDLKYAAWNGNAWEIKTVDSSDDDVGEDNSLALDAAGYPHISYFDRTNYDLKYAAWNGVYWSIKTVDGDSWVGEDNSLALDAADHPYISYFGYGLKYAQIKPLRCDFSASPRSGAAPFTVAFTDASSSWDHSTTWCFGDGEFSTEANPSHTYASPGTYTVYLTVTDDTEIATSARADYITVTAAPAPPPSPSPSWDSGDDDGNTTVFYRPPVLMGESELWFSVDIGVLKDRDIMPDDIVMFDYDGGEWLPLDTGFDRVSGNHFYYVADNPGHYLLAIGDRIHGPYLPGELLPQEIGNNPVETPTVAGPGAAPDLTPAPTPTVAPAAPAPETGGGIPVLAVAGTGAVLVGGGAVVFLRRWWMHRQNPALFRKYN